MEATTNRAWQASYTQEEKDAIKNRVRQEQAKRDAKKARQGKAKSKVRAIEDASLKSRQIIEVELDNLLGSIQTANDMYSLALQVANLGKSVAGPWTNRHILKLAALRSDTYVAKKGNRMANRKGEEKGSDSDGGLTGTLEFPTVFVEEVADDDGKNKYLRDKGYVAAGDMVSDFLINFIETYNKGMEAGWDLYKICARSMDATLDIVIPGTPEAAHWYSEQAVKGVASKLEWLTEAYYRHGTPEAKVALDEYCATNEWMTCSKEKLTRRYFTGYRANGQEEQKPATRHPYLLGNKQVGFVETTDTGSQSWDIKWIEIADYEEDRPEYSDPEMNNSKAARMLQAMHDRHVTKNSYDVVGVDGDGNEMAPLIDSLTANIWKDTNNGWDSHQLDNITKGDKLREMVVKYVNEVKAGRLQGDVARGLRRRIACNPEASVLEIACTMDLRDVPFDYKDYGYRGEKPAKIERTLPGWRDEYVWERLERKAPAYYFEPAAVKLEVVDPAKDARIIAYNNNDLKVVSNGSSMTDPREMYWVDGIQVIGRKLIPETIDGGPVEKVPIANVIRSVGAFKVLKAGSEEPRVRGLKWNMSGSTLGIVNDMFRKNEPWEAIKACIEDRREVSTQIGAELQLSAQVAGIYMGNKPYGSRLFVGNFICEPCPEVSGRPYVLRFELEELQNEENAKPSEERKEIESLDKYKHCIKEPYIIARYTTAMERFFKAGGKVPDGQ